MKSDLSKELEDHKRRLQADLQYEEQIFTPRLEVYRDLWATTFPVRITRNDVIENNERQQLAAALTQWYYEKGNGLILSPEARDLLFKGRSLLEDSTKPDKDIRTTSPN